MYGNWNNKKNMHMINYLALNAFGFTPKQLPDSPKGWDASYSATLGEKIANKIVADFYSKMQRDGFRGDKSVAEMNDLLFHQIRLNLFCVGIQEVMANPQKYKDYATFQEHLKLRLMDLLEIETTETDG
jgi:hypothetical protein